MRMLLNFFKSLSESLEKQARYRRAVNELQSLTDKQLRDMGMHRCDIHRIVYGDNYA